MIFGRSIQIVSLRTTSFNINCQSIAMISTNLCQLQISTGLSQSLKREHDGCRRESIHLAQTSPGFDLRLAPIHELSLLILQSALSGFIPGSLDFPLSPKTNTEKMVSCHLTGISLGLKLLYKMNGSFESLRRTLN